MKYVFHVYYFITPKIIIHLKINIPIYDVVQYLFEDWLIFFLTTRPQLNMISKKKVTLLLFLVLNYIFKINYDFTIDLKL